MTTSIHTSMLSVPSMVEAAVRRVRNEQQRAALLITGAAKYRRLSTLHEQEARLWTLLVRHTAEPVHRRAATDAQCVARARAREYAEVAQHWPALDAGQVGQTP
ncbi:hypothetical protein GCM10017691_02940 [Pseudonocardia petroleophila]|uniref:Uncharacterized protein n=1 Tax=Pseudonocardia petroleophila TaxID=37331 RepID=A0A7G7MKX5_9PSEU|nr:hypothetical protein [Pseudonocardia petroleophila]QNG53436.1 hypothetical protein H6H00_05505 [Pseudonocardia petroleophila]